MHQAQNSSAPTNNERQQRERENGIKQRERRDWTLHQATEESIKRRARSYYRNIMEKPFHRAEGTQIGRKKKRTGGSNIGRRGEKESLEKPNGFRFIPTTVGGYSIHNERTQ